MRLYICVTVITKLDKLRQDCPTYLLGGNGHPSPHLIKGAEFENAYHSDSINRECILLANASFIGSYIPFFKSPLNNS
ncbi:MAG: hypothetical protein ACTSRG_08400 [Candidatus Helarchaeota archaeon]